jgi:hypothetical protein
VVPHHYKFSANLKVETQDDSVTCRGRDVTGVKAAHGLGYELLLDGGVPKVLHLVVRPAREVLGYLGPPAQQSTTHIWY